MMHRKFPAMPITRIIDEPIVHIVSLVSNYWTILICVEWLKIAFPSELFDVGLLLSVQKDK